MASAMSSSACFIAPLRNASCARRMRASMEFGRAARTVSKCVRAASTSPLTMAISPAAMCAVALPGCSSSSRAMRRARRLAIPGAPFELPEREQQARRIDAALERVVQYAPRRAEVAGTRVQRRRQVGEIGALRIRGEHRVDFARARRPCLRLPRCRPAARPRAGCHRRSRRPCAAAPPPCRVRPPVDRRWRAARRARDSADPAPAFLRAASPIAVRRASNAPLR